MSARTLTNLIPNMYLALDVVSRELTGMIGGVFRNSNAEHAALNQSVVYPISSAASLIDMTPAVTSPDSGDNAVGNNSLTITKAKGYPIRWTGEDQLGAKNAGWYDQFIQNEFTQGMRAITNAVELDLCALHKKASRAYGMAGTTPFATAADLTDVTGVKKILKDNGVGDGDLQLVLGTTAMAQLQGKHSELFKAQEAGTDALLREGILTRLMGFGIGESSQFVSFTKGTGTSYVTSGSTAPGVTDIALVTGSGTVLAGDVVTFAADSVNKYVVGTGVAAPGTIKLGKPGALTTIATANAMTIGNSYTPNLAFGRHAIHLITRAPSIPLVNGIPADAADDIAYITDPRSGLTFQVRLYRQFGQALIIICLAWGCDVVKPEHVAILLG